MSYILVRAETLAVGDRVLFATELESPEKAFNVVRVDFGRDTVSVGIESCENGLRHEVIFEPESEIFVTR